MELSLFIVVATLILLAIAAYFSAAETSLMSVSRGRMHQLEKDGIKRAATVNALIADRERLLGAILLGYNLVNILASALMTDALVKLFGSYGVAIATALMTVLVLVFGEVLPKTLAIKNTDRIALALAPFAQISARVLGPFVSAVQWIVRRTLHLFGIDIDASTPVLSAREELRGTIEVHHQEGGLVGEERARLGGLLDLGELVVADVMVHRRNMVMVSADLPASEIIKHVLASVHSRIPLWRGTQENIVGIMHLRDLLRALHDAGGDTTRVDVLKVCRDPWFVPETRMLKDQLDAFLRRRGHLALVVDEYGALQGLVTLEDILEEIVGQISDEHDVASVRVRPQEDGSVIVEGTLPIRDLNRALDWNLSDENATTVAGYVIHEAQTIPDVGQVFVFDGYKFEILRRQRNQITQLRITPPPRKVETAADEKRETGT